MERKFDLTFPPEIEGVLEKAIAAMESGLCLRFQYDGDDRLVEVHAIGTSVTGRPVMRAFQVSGKSKSGEVPGWKLMGLDKVESPEIFPIYVLAPRPDYQRDDKGMTFIIRQLDAEGYSTE